MSSKRKRKAVASNEDSDDDIIEVDFASAMEDDKEEEGHPSSDEEDAEVIPMPESGSIGALREKLHARMAELRRGGKREGDGGGEAGDRDELLEERRRQRAAMRERRRKETKEKIRREEEVKGKKAKGKEKDSRTQGHQTKVHSHLFIPLSGEWVRLSILPHRLSCSYPISLLHRSLGLMARAIQTSRSPRYLDPHPGRKHNT